MRRRSKLRRGHTRFARVTPGARCAPQSLRSLRCFHRPGTAEPPGPFRCAGRSEIFRTSRNRRFRSVPPTATATSSSPTSSFASLSRPSHATRVLTHPRNARHRYLPSFARLHKFQGGAERERSSREVRRIGDPSILRKGPTGRRRTTTQALDRANEVSEGSAQRVARVEREGASVAACCRVDSCAPLPRFPRTFFSPGVVASHVMARRPTSPLNTIGDPR